MQYRLTIIISVFMFFTSGVYAPDLKYKIQNEIIEINSIFSLNNFKENLFNSEQEFPLPSIEALTSALTAYINLLETNELSNRNILTVIDFSMPSTKKRLWIIDLINSNVIINTYVAHGRNSGKNDTKHLSNVKQSHQSSMGLFLTGETYYGKHGLSLYLDGMETGLNDNARERYIVLHGAEYVSDEFIEQHGRLGRSHGCPAVPVELNEKIINIIKNRSAFFIYHPSYLNETEYLTHTSNH